MKKILFSLLMLFGMTTAFAGTGTGTFTDPYSGEWDAKALGTELMAGDYLKYDCKIVNGGGRINVTDIRLNLAITSDWTTWAVADAIDDTPWDQYKDYYAYNTPEEKKNQMFQVVEMKYDLGTFTIKGLYTGHYDRGDGSKNNPYWGVWTVAELSSRLKAGDYLAYDCDVRGSVNVTDIMLNKSVYMSGTNWSVGKSLESDMLHAYGEYRSTWNSADDRKHQMFMVNSTSIRNGNEITIKGNYTGTYPNMLVDGYYRVGSFYGLKKAIELGGSAAKIKLTNDIYLPSSGDITISNGTFSGEISGLCYVPNMMTGDMEASSFIIYGTDNPTQRKCNGAFFNALKGAKIEYLTFVNMDIPLISGDNWGLICRTAEKTHFRYICIQNTDIFGDNDNIGLVAGKTSGCMLESVSIRHSKVKTNGQYAGCLVGKSDGTTYLSCTTDMGTGIWADGTYPNAYVGGLVGYSVKDTFNTCLNMASVGGYQDEVGGIVGYSNYSEFTACYNAGQVLHCDEEEFDKALTKIRTILKTSTIDDISRINPYLLTAASVPGFVVGFVMGIGGAFLGTLLSAGLVALLGSAIITPVVGIAIITLVGVAVGLVTYWGIIKAFQQFSLDDELGGIVGRAEGGSFESCWNAGHLVCKDSYGGGIVGIGKGVTINNCMNSDASDFDNKNCGSIIGQACSFEGKKTKVTNCFSEEDYPLIGDPNGEVDEGTANNYRHYKGSPKRRATNEYEVEVRDDIVKSGILARWLNNSAENRAAGKTPWRQNLESMKVLDEHLQIDAYPTPDPTHKVVEPKFVAVDYEISDADGLIAFAAAVNSSTSSNNSGQFLRGALMNDIDMTGKSWIPIGKDESYKQFRGFFDGRGHTIKGLKCNTADKPAGLFGAVHVNAEIANVVLDENCEFTSTGDSGAGGIVGLATINWSWGSVVIENCGNNGKVNGKNHAGGIFGRVFTSVSNSENIKIYINNCYSTGEITAQEGNSGLLCGYMRQSANVSNCWSSGKLTSTNWEKPFDDTKAEPEFFVGYDGTKNITNCYAIDHNTNVKGAGMLTRQEGVSNQMGIVLTTGQLTYMLNGEKANGVWQQNLGTDEHPMFGDNGLSHSRTLVYGNYGTVCLPYSVQADDKVALYTFEAVNDGANTVTLHFKRTQTLEPGTPALFVVQATDEEYSFADTAEGEYKFVAGSTENAEWIMKGTYEKKTFAGTDAENIYYISDKQINKAKNTTIPPFRAYFDGPSLDELYGKTILLMIDGDTPTAIEFVGGNIVPAKNGKTYSLMGTEVGNGYRGIVIQNGRKVVRR